MTGASPQNVVWVRQKGQAVIAGYSFHISEKEKEIHFAFIGVFSSHGGDCCHREGRNEEEDEIFQIRLFLSTSLFQKSETTRCIMVSGCFELLQLLNGSSLPSPQNCFIVVFKTLLKSLSWILSNLLSKPTLHIEVCRLFTSF